MHGREQDGQAKQQRQQRETSNRDMHREDEAYGLAQIVIDAATEFDRTHDRGEIIIEEYDRGGFARHIRSAPAHRNADMGGLERRRIIHAIARHCNNLAIGFQSFNDAQLLLRHDAREDRDLAHALAQSGIIHRIKISAAQNMRAINASLLRNGACSGWIITRDHHHANASCATFRNRLRHAFTQRISQACQAEIGEGEGRRMVWQITQPSCARHGEDAQTFRRHLISITPHLLMRGSIQFAQRGDGLWCAFGRNRQPLFIQIPHMRDGEQFWTQAEGVHKSISRRRIMIGRMKGAFHRINRMMRACQHAKALQIIEGF